MSLFCSISGTQPLHPVVSVKSGHVFERDLILKYLADNEGKDPISGEQLAQEELVDIKTGTSAPSVIVPAFLRGWQYLRCPRRPLRYIPHPAARQQKLTVSCTHTAPAQPTAPPRAPTFTSVPSLLHTLQQEWDATMLECLELRRQSAELRQELSHALYKEDAAGRVLARVMRERDEAREALASVTATLGPDALARSGAPAAQAEGDAQMEGVEQAEAGLPADARKRVEETNQTCVFLFVWQGCATCPALIGRLTLTSSSRAASRQRAESARCLPRRRRSTRSRRLPRRTSSRRCTPPSRLASRRSRLRRRAASSSLAGALETPENVKDAG